MDDGPPPKKKSRFFSGGNRVDSSTNQATQHELASSSSSSSPQQQTSSFRSQSLPQSKNLRQDLDRDEDDNNNTEDGVESPLSTTPTTTPPRRLTSSTHTVAAVSALEGLSVRDTRRDGIYGREALLPRSGSHPDSDVSESPAGILPSDSGAHQQPGLAVAQRDALQHQQVSILAGLRPSPLAQLPQSAFQGAQHQQQYNGGVAEIGGLGGNVPLLVAQDQHIETGATVPQTLQGVVTAGTTNDHVSLLQGAPVAVPPDNPLPTGGQAPFVRPTVDLDRDNRGKLLVQAKARAIASMKNNPGLTNRLPYFATIHPAANRREPDVPANLYTSPNRVVHATNAARSALKRKRPIPILPPPAYVYTRTGDPSFNIFCGILLYPEIVFCLASHLPVATLISLYAISRDFHTILDTRFTTTMLSQSLRKAPQSSRVFQFRCYNHLCRTDPAARIPHPDPAFAAAGLIRKVPSLRWLQMVMHREKVVQEIMALFAEHGTPLPARCALAIKKLWFLLDIPDNARRIGYIHCRSLVTDLDLYFAMCFFVKMDMLFNDPVGAEKRDGLRKLVLSQRGFEVLTKVLKRECWRKKGDLIVEWVRWRYEPRDDERHLPSIFGVEMKWVGKLKMEYWGHRKFNQKGKKVVLLLRPDQLVMREAIRRGLRFTKHFLRCMLYGYVRPDTLEDYEPRTYGRRIPELKDEEYGMDDVVGGVDKLDVEDGGDELLDLGPGRQASLLTIEREEIGNEEKEARQKLEEFVERCMEWSETERRKLEKSGDGNGDGNEDAQMEVDDLL